jgi:membrane fusion protein (multidrug efflux system)
VLLRKQVVIVALLGALAAGGYYAYQEYGPRPESSAAAGKKKGARAVGVEVAKVERQRLSNVTEAVGTTRAAQSIQIVPHASGRIVALDIAPGAEVKAGQVLARLDDEIQRADVTEARAQLQEKTRVVERSEALRRNKTVSISTLEQAQAELAAATADLERAVRRLEDRVVRAPFDGVVGLTSTDVGARVDNATVLTTLDDLSSVEIEFAMPETLYGNVKIGQPVSAKTAAFQGRTFTGAVISVDSRIDRTSRSFKVRARLPNPERVLPSGMFMFVSITLEENEALVVPETAVVAQSARNVVFVIANDKAEMRTITVGQRKAGVVEVTDGLSLGEVVAVTGLQRIRDKATVRINKPGGGRPAGKGQPGGQPEARPGQAKANGRGAG